MSERVVARTEWRVARVAEARMETPRTRRIALDVPGWPGSLAGQHLDVRLTAEDGYQATRSYSLASVGDGERIELLVDRVDDGEVSSYLVDELRADDRLEVLGPLGRWFVWAPPTAAAPAAAAQPVVMVAGGAGVVPMISILRARHDARSAAPMRLLYSVRGPDEILFADELASARTDGVRVELAYTRRGPGPSESADAVPVGRIGRERLAAFVGEAAAHPLLYVCGTTGFVEQMLAWLVDDGHADRDIRAERFGGT